MILVGMDVGNNTMISSMEGYTGTKAIVIPTVYSNYQDYKTGLESGEKKPLIDCLDAEITLNVTNNEKIKKLGRFFVGNMPLHMENVKTLMRDNGSRKLKDEGLLICMLTTLAYSAIVKQKKENGRVTADINLVTGLPFLQYKEDKLAFSEQFKGNHIVKFYGDYDVTVELRIQDCHTDCEGAGALNKSIFNDKGAYIYSEDELFDKFMVGLDIGEFTSEAIVLKFVEKNNMVVPEYVTNLCTGIDSGIANAKQHIIDYIRETKKTVIDRYTIDKCVKRSRRQFKLDLISGEEYDIKDEYDGYLKELAQDISAKVINKFQNANIIGKIKELTLFGGGCSTMLGDYIVDKLETTLNTKVTISENALTANADGFLEKARAIYSTNEG